MTSTLERRNKRLSASEELKKIWLQQPIYDPYQHKSDIPLLSQDEPDQPKPVEPDKIEPVFIEPAKSCLVPINMVTTMAPTGNNTEPAKRMDSDMLDDNDIDVDIVDKRHVVIHVTFLKFGEINTLKETFEADVLLRAKWREPMLDKGTKPDTPIDIPIAGEIDLNKYWNPEIYIDNIVGEPKRSSSIYTEYNANGEAFIIERRRVKGTFMEQMELWEFPFDVQDLSVTIMSEKSNAEVEIIDDPDEIHKIYKQSFIDEQEWYLYKYIESEKLDKPKDLADPSIMRSSMMVCCRAARRPAYFLWNSFSVTFLICCLSFASFAVEGDLVQNRLLLTFTLVLTTVTFKFVINQSLPKISYLTYLDRYIIATMIVVVSVCFWHAIQTLIPEKDQTNKIALVIIAGCYLIYNIQFLFRILLVPYKRRREMKRAEQKYIKLVQEQSELSRSTKRQKSKNKRKKDSDLKSVTTHM